MTGRMLNEKWGKISFWTMFVGFNLAFFPMHILGFLGMPRRIYTYAPGLGWDGINVLVTIGSFLFGLGTGITLVNWVVCRFRGAPAGDNPWDADSLEWSTTSPPPDWNFEAIPVVTGRHPLWDAGEMPEASSGDDEATLSLGPPGAAERQTPITTGLDARPESTMDITRPTYLPLVLALGLMAFFIGLLIKAVLVGVIGVALGTMGILWWTWRTEADLR
jgi:cytochrome c oxidase subunit 1/cytochrome c oxidase subunit I+III